MLRVREPRWSHRAAARADAACRSPGHEASSTAQAVAMLARHGLRASAAGSDDPGTGVATGLAGGGRGRRGAGPAARPARDAARRRSGRASGASPQAAEHPLHGCGGFHRSGGTSRRRGGGCGHERGPGTRDRHRRGASRKGAGIRGRQRPRGLRCRPAQRRRCGAGRAVRPGPAGRLGADARPGSAGRRTATPTSTFASACTPAACCSGGGVDDEGQRSAASAVNIAARMEQTAPAGGLRISHDTYASCARHLRCRCPGADRRQGHRRAARHLPRRARQAARVSRRDPRHRRRPDAAWWAARPSSAGCSRCSGRLPRDAVPAPA